MNDPNFAALDAVPRVLAAALSSTATSLTIESGYASLPAIPFEIKVGDEIIAVGARSGNVLSALTRGSAGTSAAPHNKWDAVAYGVSSTTLAAGGGGGGGSSSALTNWCRVEVDNGTPATVTVGAPEYDCVAADFRIPTQAGSDFTIADSLLQPGTGALYSAAGGKFEVAVRMTVPSNITLDGGSPATRYILVGLVGGNPHVFPNGDGIDYVMALDSTISSTPTEQKRMGPMQVAAGGEVFTNLQLALIAGTGTDQIVNVQATVVEIYVWNL